MNHIYLMKRILSQVFMTYLKIQSHIDPSIYSKNYYPRICLFSLVSSCLKYFICFVYFSSHLWIHSSLYKSNKFFTCYRKLYMNERNLWTENYAFKHYKLYNFFVFLSLIQSYVLELLQYSA